MNLQTSTAETFVSPLLLGGAFVEGKPFRKWSYTSAGSPLLLGGAFVEGLSQQTV